MGLWFRSESIHGSGVRACISCAHCQGYGFRVGIVENTAMGSTVSRERVGWFVHIAHAAMGYGLSLSVCMLGPEVWR